ncbi:hypothetical protein ACFOSH_12360, partial [Amycolatopsis speibonae]
WFLFRRKNNHPKPEGICVPRHTPNTTSTPVDPSSLSLFPHTPPCAAVVTGPFRRDCVDFLVIQRTKIHTVGVNGPVSRRVTFAFWSKRTRLATRDHSGPPRHRRAVLAATLAGWELWVRTCTALAAEKDAVTTRETV